MDKITTDSLCITFLRQHAEQETNQTQSNHQHERHKTLGKHLTKLSTISHSNQQTTNPYQNTTCGTTSSHHKTHTSKNVIRFVVQWKFKTINKGLIAATPIDYSCDRHNPSLTPQNTHTDAHAAPRPVTSNIQRGQWFTKHCTENMMRNAAR